MLVVLDSDGEVAFVTEPICPHEDTIRRRLAETVSLGPVPGTLSCVHRRHLWSATDGAYLGSGSCRAMVNFPFKVEYGRLSVLMPVGGIPVELARLAS